MKEFKDKVAVITGAASGIGMELAFKCAKEGMKLAIADIDVKRMRRVERRLKRQGASVLALETDVSKLEDLENLKEKTLQTYGEVNLLVNNAAIGNTKFTWNYTLNDWEWQLGVVLLSVIHGIRLFVPLMLKQNNECHIVNVSSIEGLLQGSGPGGAIYGMSKHAVVSLSETLRAELEAINSNIIVSVVCPGWVSTRIIFGDIHRPQKYQNSPEEQLEDNRNEVLFAKRQINIEEMMEASPSITPQKAAEIIFNEVREERFYILTHKDYFIRNMVKERFDEILDAFENKYKKL